MMVKLLIGNQFKRNNVKVNKQSPSHICMLSILTFIYFSLFLLICLKQIRIGGW